MLLEHAVEQIDARRRVARVRANGEHRELRYDKVILATGAVPIRPPIPGIDVDGVYQLHTIGDSLVLHDALDRDPERAVIVGAGYIGLEMAESLRTRGVGVTVVEQLPAVLPTVDPELGALVRDELDRNEVRVITSSAVIAIERQDNGLIVRGDPELALETDLVLVVVGVRPDTKLAERAGAETGPRGALQVDRHMQTNLPDMYAAGDCIVTYHRLLATDTYLPLGTTAHKQGRIAGENAVGGQRSFEGSLGTQVVKIFDLAVARTGVRDEDAHAAGLHPLTVESRSYDHKAYYPGAHEITMRITGDQRTGMLLGAQLLGNIAAQIPKRIDIAASALFHGMTVAALDDLDLSYTPPFGSAWDAVQLSAHDWSRARDAAAQKHVT